MRLVTIGDCGVDRYLPENRLLPGGITANFTRQARRTFNQDDKIDLISTIGIDNPESSVAYDAVNIDGISCHINKIEGNTPIQFIEIGDDGEKNFTRYEPGVLEKFYLNKEQKQILYKADLIVTPVYWQIQNIFDLLFSQDLKATMAVDFSDFSTDPNFSLLDKYLYKIDIAFFGLKSSQKEVIKKLHDIAKVKNKLFIITLGEDGSIAYVGHKKFSCAALSIKKIIDTTGASDAFAAGFLAEYTHHKSINSALQKGAEVAAKTIQTVGSVPK